MYVYIYINNITYISKFLLGLSKFWDSKRMSLTLEIQMELIQTGEMWKLADFQVPTTCVSHISHMIQVSQLAIPSGPRGRNFPPAMEVANGLQTAIMEHEGDQSQWTQGNRFLTQQLGFPIFGPPNDDG